MADENKQKILIVDDRPENLLSLEIILEDDNIELIKAGSGEEALKHLLKVDVALILLDVQMPGMDGFETATFIRSSPRTKHIPIIFVTAISKEQKHIFKGYESGAVDYMFKPLDPDILKNKVKIFLELDRRKRDLELKNIQLESARANTDNILNNVTTGLFLLDRSFNIKPQYSLVLETIFAHKDLGNINFIKFLETKIFGKEISTCKEYLDLLYKDDLAEKTLIELNPFKKLELNFEIGREKILDKRALSFSFKRIYKNDKINEIIVTVDDITEKIKLKEKLEESEVHSKKQMELMFNILHVEPSLLLEFMESVQQELENINFLIKQNENVSESENMLKQIFRSIHMIKGNASLLDLKFFVNRAHKIEDIISRLQEKADLTEKDFLSLVLQIGDLENIVLDINDLIERIENIQTNFRPKRAYENKLFIQSLENLAVNLANDLKKQITFDSKQFDPNHIPYRYKLVSKEILIQLIRNSIYHGIENPEERSARKKDKKGKIQISSSNADDKCIIRVWDDGNGIDTKRLRDIAKKLKIADAKKIAGWDEDELVEVIFHQGASTSETADQIAGRGVGLTSVKDKLNKLSGEILVKFKKDIFSEFVVTIPLKNQEDEISKFNALKNVKSKVSAKSKVVNKKDLVEN